MVNLNNSSFTEVIIMPQHTLSKCKFQKCVFAKKLQTRCKEVRGVKKKKRKKKHRLQSLQSLHAAICLFKHFLVFHLMSNKCSFTKREMGVLDQAAVGAWDVYFII